MVEVDKEKCVGCGLCTSICDSVFEMDDEEGKAKIKEDADTSADCVKEAEEQCPTDAISQ